MKAPTILLLAASCLLLDVETASVRVITLEDSPIRAIGDRIKEALELFKEQMKNGNPKLGIPVLEPLDLERQNINIQEEKFSLEGSIGDVHVEGLSDYIVQFADFKIGKKNLTIDMLWNGIKGKASYDLDGLVSGKLPIYGTGIVDFEVKGFRFATQAKLKLNLAEKKVAIDNFANTIIAVDSIKVSITGLYNDDEFSEMVGAVISENAPDVIDDFQQEITAEVEQVALKYANEILESISLDDIMGIIN